MLLIIEPLIEGLFVIITLVGIPQRRIMVFQRVLMRVSSWAVSTTHALCRMVHCRIWDAFWQPL